MKVVEYLKTEGLELLAEELGITVKQYDEGLIVLNYDQIESPKAHPVVVECRGLILDSDYNVVSRSFDRFFNLGEQPQTQAHIDMSKARLYDKVDGSLIKIYNWKGTWYVSTRGTAFAEGRPTRDLVTFKDLVFKALKIETEYDFQNLADALLDKDWTYICELTSFENRVVKHYQGYMLHYLHSRSNTTYEYGGQKEENAACSIGATPIKSYSFDSIDACIEASKELKDLDEGYVLYQDNLPVAKIKSPTYVAIHLIRGEGLTVKRVCQLVLNNGQDEYLSYFPEDAEVFVPYVQAYANLISSMNGAAKLYFGIESQKDFALAISKLPYKSVLFKARKEEISVLAAFNGLSEKGQIDMLLDSLPAGNSQVFDNVEVG